MLPAPQIHLGRRIGHIGGRILAAAVCPGGRVVLGKRIGHINGIPLVADITGCPTNEVAVAPGSGMGLGGAVALARRIGHINGRVLAAYTCCPEGGSGSGSGGSGGSGQESGSGSGGESGSGGQSGSGSGQESGSGSGGSGSGSGGDVNPCNPNSSSRGCYPCETGLYLGCLSDARPDQTPDAYAFTGQGFGDTRLNHTFELFGQPPPTTSACFGVDVGCGNLGGCCLWQWTSTQPGCSDLKIYFGYAVWQSCDSVYLYIQTRDGAIQYGEQSGGCGTQSLFRCQAGEMVTLPLVSNTTGLAAPASVTVSVAPDANFCGGCCVPPPSDNLTGTVTVTGGGACPALDGAMFSLVWSDCITSSYLSPCSVFDQGPGWKGDLVCGGIAYRNTLTCNGAQHNALGYCLVSEAFLLDRGPDVASCTPFRLEWDNVACNTSDICGCDTSTTRVKIVITP